jgi:hypothetical protein
MVLALELNLKPGRLSTIRKRNNITYIKPIKVVEYYIIKY